MYVISPIEIALGSNLGGIMETSIYKQREISVDESQRPDQTLH